MQNANRLCDLIGLTLDGIVFTEVLVRTLRRREVGLRIGSGAERHSPRRGRWASRFISVGHQGEYQSLQSINPVLHVVRSR